MGTSGIHKAREGHPATIRLLDPPLHEFLPHDIAGQEEVAEVMRVPVNVIREKVSALHEFNPMLGHRGCRLGITYPEISEMQARAIMEAACNVHNEGNQGARRDHDPARWEREGDQAPARSRRAHYRGGPR